MTIYKGRTYLQKHRFLSRKIESPPPSDLRFIVIIPCYNEADILSTLNSLSNCNSPSSSIEIIIVINSASNASPEIKKQNERTQKQVRDWLTQHQWFFGIHIIYVPELPPKHAGVGLARKIGMDEAIDRFEQAGQEEGILICLDADTLVRKDYFIQIQRFFQENPLLEAASIHFQHPIEGSDFDQKVYDGIIQYELFLRYYIQGLRYARYPFAFHTIGSAMVVRAQAYQSRGGMNRRKAGEDFYFLHKFIEEGKLGEIKDTWVIPSPRPSAKVPFGTGKAIIDWLNKDQNEMEVYDPLIFVHIKGFIELIPDYYLNHSLKARSPLSEFLKMEGFDQKLNEISSHVASQDAFVKRVFKWLDGLKILKMVHYLRDHHFPSIPISYGAKELINLYSWEEAINSSNPRELLIHYRQWQKGEHLPIDKG